jgi:hypothetical protein
MLATEVHVKLLVTTTTTMGDLYIYIDLYGGPFPFYWWVSEACLCWPVLGADAEQRFGLDFEVDLDRWSRVGGEWFLNAHCMFP